MSVNPPFIPGLRLSEMLFEEAVQPILAKRMPRLRYTAALVGSGSEVLGYDTERSTDHDWGLRLLIMMPESEPRTTHDDIVALLGTHLPSTIGGYPTRFIDSPLEPGTPVLATGPTDAPTSHGVTTGTVAGFLMSKCGIATVDELDAASWLTISEQHLLEVISGGVWRDDVGELTRARQRLAWYPDDVWRYRLAAGWKRIAQHEAFIGRTGELDDDLGSHVITLSLVRDIMHLTFLLERQYAPYEKWLGHAFARLTLAPTLTPMLDRARFGKDWPEREAAIVDAVSVLAHAQNELDVCPWVDPTPRPFFNRPFQVMFADRFSDALTGAITDPAVRAMPDHLGGIDQYIDSTDGREWIGLHVTIREWLRSLATGGDTR